MSSVPGITIAAAAIAFALFAFALLALILWISSLLGWKTWSRYFPANPPPDAKPMFSFRTGGFAWWASYNWCLRVIPQQNGLCIRPIVPFVWFHPWILLPFENLEDCLRRHRSLRLEFRAPHGARFFLYLPARAENLIPPDKTQ